MTPMRLIPQWNQASQILFNVVPMRDWAHWTFAQRSIQLILANKTAILKRDKSNPVVPEIPGNLIVACRKAVGPTQERLAELSGIHRQWIGRWERGRALPSATDWGKLQAVLGLPVEPKLS